MWYTKEKAVKSTFYKGFARKKLEQNLFKNLKLKVSAKTKTILKRENIY